MPSLPPTSSSMARTRPSQTQAVDHAYLEPEAGVGWLDDETVLNLRVATPVVEHFRAVATILGHPESRFRWDPPCVGRRFGGQVAITGEAFGARVLGGTRVP